MAADYPDFQPNAGLISAIATLDTDIKALTAGFGSGTTILSTAGTIASLGGPNIVLAALSGKTHCTIAALLSWHSLSGGELRGFVRIGISVDGGGSYFYVTLTPERPSIPLQFGSGVPTSAPNTPIYVFSSPGAGCPNTTETQLPVSLVYYDK